MPGRQDYVRSSAHRFECSVDLTHTEEPRIHGFGSVHRTVGDIDHRTVFLTLEDEHDHARVTAFLSLDQAERTGRLLLDLVQRTRALVPAEGPAVSRSARVELLTAWPPPEGGDGE